jgi:hypothetical protein
LGKGAGKQRGAGESCADSWDADALGSRTKKDRRGAKGSMGEGEGGEESGLGTSEEGRNRGREDRTLQTDRPEDSVAEIRQALKFIPPERLGIRTFAVDVTGFRKRQDLSCAISKACFSSPRFGWRSSAAQARKPNGLGQGSNLCFPKIRQ